MTKVKESKKPVAVATTPVKDQIILPSGIVIPRASLPMCMTPKEAYTVDYPEVLDLVKKQNEALWFEDEVEVEKDVQSLLVDCTESERHGIITVLRLFTKYELKVGDEHWGGVIKHLFQRPADIQRMANCFSFVELNVHAPFYNKINEALNLNTDEFYLSYVKDPTLRSRMGFIDTCLNSPEPMFSVGTFAMIEGGVLYSNFSFLKHFQSQGKNKANNIVAGINFSVRDENLHHLGGAWLFRQLCSELALTPAEQKDITAKLHEATMKICEHEDRIIEMIFEKGPMDGITATQMKLFVRSRLDLCLQNLGLPEIFFIKPEDNVIASWFYKGISSYIFHDFFNRVGNQYKRGWNQDRFVWLNKEQLQAA